jgi:hypothetical protein
MDNASHTVLPGESDYIRRADKRLDRGGAPGLGGTPIIMVFAILCLTIFAALTLSTASSEYNLSSKYAESVSEYYNADAEGVRFVAAIKKSVGDEANADEYASAAEAIGAAVEKNDSGAVITRDIAVDDNQVLRIMLNADASGLRVVSWKIVYIGTWVADNTFNLWTGN